MRTEVSARLIEEGRIILRRGSRAEGPVRFANAVTRNAVKGEVQEEEKGEDPR